MIFHFYKDLLIDQALRKELSRPFGRIMSTEQLVRHMSRKEKVYAVGDVTLAELLKQKYTPRVGIFDYRSDRLRTYFPIIKKTYKDQLQVKNTRGTLSKDLWNAVKKSSASKYPIGIKVRGEEDLASLACIYFARDGEFVVYGLRGKGMVVIKINKEIKDYVIKVLNRMSKI